MNLEALRVSPLCRLAGVADGSLLQGVSAGTEPRGGAAGTGGPGKRRNKGVALQD